MSIKKNKKTSRILSLFLVFGILGPVQYGKGESKPSAAQIEAEAAAMEAKRKREAEEAKIKQNKLNQEKLDKAKNVVKAEQAFLLIVQFA